MALAKLNNVTSARIAKINGVNYSSVRLFDGQEPAAAAGLTAGLVVHLDAGDASSYSGSGTDWLDLTASNVDGVLVNGPVYDASDGGGSFYFDGTNDGFLIDYDDAAALRPSAADLDGDGYTVQMWAKNVAGEQVCLSCGTYDSPNHYYGMELAAQSHSSLGQRILVHIFEGTANNSPASRRSAATSWGSHSAATWYLFTFILPSNEYADVDFYLNADVVATTVGSGTGDNNSPGYHSSRDSGIGYNRGTFREGYVSQVIVYDKALSSSEVGDNFDATKSRYGY